MVPKKILIVEDDIDIANILSRRLQSVGYECDIAYDGAKACKMLGLKTYDMITLDIMIPYINGLDMCDIIHKQNPKTLIITISALDSDEKKNIAYANGSDDFIAKPFNAKELVMKVNALFRRQEINASSNINVLGNSLLVNEDAKTVTLNGADIAFTKIEYHIFKALADNKKAVLSRQAIAEILWDLGFESEDWRVIDSHIYHMRKKLCLIDEKYKNVIKTVRGFGYRFNES